MYLDAKIPRTSRNLRPVKINSMAELGKTLLGLGIVFVAIGMAMLLASRFGLPFDKLPGDLHWRSRSGNTQVYFPLASSIILSILFSLILWLLRNFKR